MQYGVILCAKTVLLLRNIAAAFRRPCCRGRATAAAAIKTSSGAAVNSTSPTLIRTDGPPSAACLIRWSRPTIDNKPVQWPFQGGRFDYPCLSKPITSSDWLVNNAYTFRSRPPASISVEMYFGVVTTLLRDEKRYIYNTVSIRRIPHLLY